MCSLSSVGAIVEMSRRLLRTVDVCVDSCCHLPFLVGSLERDAWAAAREHLVADPVNAASLSTVDTALFALCLDDAAPKVLAPFVFAEWFTCGVK